MNRKLMSALLSAAMMASLAVPALAAEAGTRPPLIAPNPVIAPKPVICPPAGPFADVVPGTWFTDAVWYVKNEGIMAGVGENTFAPNATVSRAMIVSMLWRMAGSPVVNYAMDLTDVAGDAWYAEAVRWALSEQIAAVPEDKTFAPDQDITREELATLIYGYAKSRDKGFQGCWAFRLPYADAAEISEAGYEPICWCVASKVLSGNDKNQMDPQGLLTRAETAVVFQNLSKNVEW